VAPEWARLVEQEPGLAELFAEVPAAELAADQPTLEGMPASETERLAAFLHGAGGLLDGYFAVEDPQRLEPAERESLISTLVDDELLIRGYIDRLDVSPSGDLRVVDYKTGGAPREAFEGRALFQLKFYALVLWRTRGVVPKVLRLLYLKDAEICDYSPDAEELERFERTLIALSRAVERAKRERDFRPKPSRLCGWCSHQRFCPEFGGTPPPYPEPVEIEAPPAEPALRDIVMTAARVPGVVVMPVPVPGAAAGEPVPGGDRLG
jgi:putative RecB family exonuclease